MTIKKSVFKKIIITTSLSLVVSSWAAVKTKHFRGSGFFDEITVNH